MSKNKILVTPAMKAEVERELQAAKDEVAETEDSYFKAQDCLATMQEVQDCKHEIERIQVGREEKLSCTICHFLWVVD